MCYRDGARPLGLHERDRLYALAVAMMTTADEAGVLSAEQDIMDLDEIERANEAATAARTAFQDALDALTDVPSRR